MEKVPPKENMKELPPPPPKKKHRSQSPPHSRGKCSKSQSRSCTQKYEGMIYEANPGLQAEMIDTDIADSQGAVHTPGLKDPHLKEVQEITLKR